MTNYQPGIMEDIPALARYQFFRLKPGTDPRQPLQALARIAVDQDIVVGLGTSLLSVLGADVPGMHKMPEFDGKGIDTPSTPFALVCWIRGKDRGDLLHKARLVRQTLETALTVAQVTDAFCYEASRDLTGYEDGTENPIGDDALAAAFLQSDQPALAGSSFLALQQWVHNLDDFQAMTMIQQDHTIGRSRETNVELDDAPLSAHVKRTAQEDFDPEAFILRRSMPWANETTEGLMFAAFGKNFDAFEMLLQRMLGMDDGIVDALFTFSRPVTGSYFWCPPIADGVLNLDFLSS